MSAAKWQNSTGRNFRQSRTNLDAKGTMLATLPLLTNLLFIVDVDFVEVLIFLRCNILKMRVNGKWRKNEILSKILSFPLLTMRHCPILEEEDIFGGYIYNCSSCSS